MTKFKSIMERRTMQVLDQRSMRNLKGGKNSKTKKLKSNNGNGGGGMPPATGED